jgi:arylsulfatase
MWPVIAEGKASPRDEILHNVEPSGRGAIRRGDWKLVVDGNNPKRGEEDKEPTTELFNIAQDPFEQHDLAARHPERVRTLQARLDAYAAQAFPAKGSHRPEKPKEFQVPAVWGPADG